MPDQKMIEHINGLVADATVIYFKLHNYHWNLRGPSFFTLHDKFEELYNEWAGTLDELAERALSLGGHPPLNLKQCLELTVIKEETEILPAEKMVAQTLADFHQARHRMTAAREYAQETGDKTTENILDEFIDSLAKHDWMLGAFIDRAVSQD